MNKPFISINLPTPVQAENLLQQVRWLFWEIPIHISSIRSEQFLREIRQLEQLIIPYVNDIPQSNIRQRIMNFERELTKDTSRRFAEHGPAWIPGRDERRHTERKLDRTSASSVWFTELAQRYEGLRSRIESENRRLIQPPQFPTQSSWETTQQHQSYVRLFAFQKELIRILNDIPSLDKTARPFTKSRISEINWLVWSMDTRDMSEWDILKESIQHLISNCLDAIKKKPKKSPLQNNIKNWSPKNLHSHQTWQVWGSESRDSQEIYNKIIKNAPYMLYLDTLSKALRNVTAEEDNKSFWDGPFRQNAVSPFIRRLHDKLSSWNLDAHSFAWSQVVTDMRITDNYWQIVQKKLQACTNTENFSTNMDSFFALIESVIEDSRINCLVLRWAISWFRSKTAYPTHNISK
jgi:hypothetical protein